jgi:hypothetical protein
MLRFPRRLVWEEATVVKIDASCKAWLNSDDASDPIQRELISKNFYSLFLEINVDLTPSVNSGVLQNPEIKA